MEPNAKISIIKIEFNVLNMKEGTHDRNKVNYGLDSHKKTTYSHYL